MTSTFVNDLRLNEQGTGDNSGSWGTVTNTNLELIGEALGFGTEAPFNTDANKTTTVLDGASDPARAMYFKVTSTVSGGLTATRQLTIAPDTISRLMFIENATTGGESITIKQGSGGGAAVTIPNGDTKAVILPGSGSGSIVLDAFASLSVVDLKVQDDLTVTDDVAIGGTLAVTGVLTTTAATVFNGGFASNAASTITTADNAAQLTLISTDADANAGPKLKLRRNSASPADDDLIGSLDWTSENSDGDEHDFLNLTARMRDVTAGSEDVAYAWTAYLGGTGREVQSFTNTDDSVASMVFNEDSQDIDFRVESNNLANMLVVDAAEDKVFIGHGTTHEYDAFGAEIIMQIEAAGTAPYAGIGMIQNSNDTDVGPLIFGKSRGTSLGSTTIVQDGDLLGRIEFQGMDGADLETGASIFAAVDGTPGANDMPGRLVFNTTADNANSATERMRIDSSGNVIIASTGGTLITTTAGTSNFRAGANAGNSIASGGNYNICIGDDAGTAITTGGANVAIGFDALKTEDEHGFNIAIGHSSLKVLNCGASGFNTAVGDQTGKSLTLGIHNTLIGGRAGDLLTHSDFNTAVGVNALGADTLGFGSVAIGVSALQNMNFTSSTETRCTAVGFQAGLLNQTGTDNTLIGAQCGNAITTGFQNTGVGHDALGATDDGQNNVAVGFLALNGNCGDNNTAVGESALAVATGTNNQCFGNSAGAAITSGNYNTILGQFDGNGSGLDIRTSSNNIVLADGQGNPRIFYKHANFNVQIEVPAASNNALIVHNTAGSDVYGLQIDNDLDINNNSNWFIHAIGNTTSRFKVFTTGNVVNTNNSYGSISDVKLKENIVDASSQWDDIKALTVRKYSMKADELDAPNMLGVIAQELETAGMGGLVNESADIDKDMNDLGTTTKVVNYSILYMKAVKALQEAMTRIETLETKVAALEG